MRIRKAVAGALIVVAGLCLLSAKLTFAEELLMSADPIFTYERSFLQTTGPCNGNFDCDQDVDGTDAAVFKEDFDRSPFKNPCTPDAPSECIDKILITVQTASFANGDHRVLIGSVFLFVYQCIVCANLVHYTNTRRRGGRDSIFDSSGCRG